MRTRPWVAALARIPIGSGALCPLPSAIAGWTSAARQHRALVFPGLRTTPNRKLNSLPQGQRFSLRLVFLRHIRFTAQSSAPLGSFFQPRLCSCARRIPQYRAVPRFRALWLRSAPGIDSASLRLFPRHLRNECFYWPTKAQLEPTRKSARTLTVEFSC